MSTDLSGESGSVAQAAGRWRHFGAPVRARARTFQDCRQLAVPTDSSELIRGRMAGSLNVLFATQFRETCSFMGKLMSVASHRKLSLTSQRLRVELDELFEHRFRTLSKIGPSVRRAGVDLEVTERLRERLGDQRCIIGCAAQQKASIATQLRPDLVDQAPSSVPI
jgi:hypothetical protein